MKQMLAKYDVPQDIMTLYCEKKSFINISKNHVQYRKTKHIYIYHHFICEPVEEKKISLDHVSNEKQLADLFAKALVANHFEALRSAVSLCVMCL